MEYTNKLSKKRSSIFFTSEINIIFVGENHQKLFKTKFMMENTNIKWNELSDSALLVKIGQFVQQTRLKQNKSQQQVADAAGINRSTLSQIENGRGGTLITLIQILRVLDQISFLKIFQVEEKPSPLYLAKMEMKKRKRSSKTNDPKSYPLPDW